jgi:uncharacterized protein YjbJ (UPF0337 family)
VDRSSVYNSFAGLGLQDLATGCPSDVTDFQRWNQKGARSFQMEKEQVTGKVDELKGKVKQGIGKATDNPNLQAEGLVDEAKGKVKQAYGDLKNAVKSTDKKAGADVNKK